MTFPADKGEECRYLLQSRHHCSLIPNKLDVGITVKNRAQYMKNAFQKSLAHNESPLLAFEGLPCSLWTSPSPTQFWLYSVDGSLEFRLNCCEHDRFSFRWKKSGRPYNNTPTGWTDQAFVQIAVSNPSAFTIHVQGIFQDGKTRYPLLFCQVIPTTPPPNSRYLIDPIRTPHNSSPPQHKAESLYPVIDVITPSLSAKSRSYRQLKIRDTRKSPPTVSGKLRRKKSTIAPILLKNAASVRSSKKKKEERPPSVDNRSNDSQPPTTPLKMPLLPTPVQSWKGEVPALTDQNISIPTTTMSRGNIWSCGEDKSMPNFFQLPTLDYPMPDLSFFATPFPPPSTTEQLLSQFVLENQIIFPSLRNPQDFVLQERDLVLGHSYVSMFPDCDRTDQELDIVMPYNYQN